MRQPVARLVLRTKDTVRGQLHALGLPVLLLVRRRENAAHRKILECSVLFHEAIRGALVMGPMTKGSNLPYRRLCAELGARVLVSEMVVARRLKQRRRGEFALLRRTPDEPCFGIQLAGNQADEMAWAAALAESRGADFVDVNLGCPIDHFTRKGLGAALARQPSRVRHIIETMRAAVAVPVTAKIRLGWNTTHRNYLDLAQALVDGGVAALTVHGRTREARYRQPAEWDVIAEVAARMPIPVVGNGDLLFGHDVPDWLARSGCAAVMTARASLIRPWIFREVDEGYRDLTPDARVAIYRRYVDLAEEHWGADAHGHARLREFLRWHVGFWVRDVPRRADGTWPTMQRRESFAPRSPLEALFSRTDDAALDYITDELLRRGDFLTPPDAGDTATAPAIAEAG
jgi:tRNA-dihydrouridine synthase 3